MNIQPKFATAIAANMATMAANISIVHLIDAGISLPGDKCEVRATAFRAVEKAQKAIAECLMQPLEETK